MTKLPDVIFDAALTGNISTRSGRAIIAALEKEGVAVVTSAKQKVLIQRRQKVFPLTLKTDRALDELVKLVRLHTPRDVIADFSVTMISDGVCSSIARICEQPLSGLMSAPTSSH